MTTTTTAPTPTPTTGGDTSTSTGDVGSEVYSDVSTGDFSGSVTGGEGTTFGSVGSYTEANSTSTTTNVQGDFYQGCGSVGQSSSDPAGKSAPAIAGAADGANKTAAAAASGFNWGAAVAVAALIFAIYQYMMNKKEKKKQDAAATQKTVADTVGRDVAYPIGGGQYLPIPIAEFKPGVGSESSDSWYSNGQYGSQTPAPGAGGGPVATPVGVILPGGTVVPAGSSGTGAGTLAGGTAASSGPSVSTYLIGGGVLIAAAVGAYLLFRSPESGEGSADSDAERDGEQAKDAAAETSGGEAWT